MQLAWSALRLHYLIVSGCLMGCHAEASQTKHSPNMAQTTTEFALSDAGAPSVNGSLDASTASIDTPEDSNQSDDAQDPDASVTSTDSANDSNTETFDNADADAETDDTETSGAESTSEASTDTSDIEDTSSEDESDTGCVDETTILPSLDEYCGSLFARDFLALALGTRVVELQWLASSEDILVCSHRDAFTELTITTTYNDGEIRCTEYCPTGDEGPDPLPGLAIDVEMALQSADGALAERWQTELGGRIRQANFDDDRAPPRFDGTLEVELVDPDYENERVSLSGHFTEDRIWGDIMGGASHKHPDGPGVAGFLGLWRSK